MSVRVSRALAAPEKNARLLSISGHKFSDNSYIIIIIITHLFAINK